MKTIGISAELDVVLGETKVKEFAKLINRAIDIPGIGEAWEQELIERGLSFAETIGEHNLPRLIEVANAFAAKFNKGPLRIAAYTK